MHVSTLRALDAFTTLDGSEIRELVGPAWTPARNQSLAEATVPPGGTTFEHHHVQAEELYYVTHGRMRIRLADELRELEPGDCVVIPPGTPHKVWNIGEEPLRFLCCCAPAYTHDDTVITESE